MNKLKKFKKVNKPDGVINNENNANESKKKKSRVIKIIAIFLIILIISLLIFFNLSKEVVQNVDNETEIEPEQEISEEQMRQTLITLYFEDKNSMQLVKEERNVDAKDLIDNPYLYVVKMLIQGPKDENLQNPIPQDTKVNKVEFKNKEYCVYVDLSKEFLNSSGMNAIYSIVNTLTEFKEVNSVKILIDGEENSQYKESFVRKD